MSLTITINNIDTLTDMERAVLRLVAADPCAAGEVSTAIGSASQYRSHSEPPIPAEGYPVVPTFLRSEPVTTSPVVIAEGDRVVIAVTSNDPDNRRVVGGVVGTVAPAPAPDPMGVGGAFAAVVPAILIGQPVTNSAAWTPAGSAELDARGLPWDKRIHASTRTQTRDGLWKYARGVDKLLVPQVEAELLAVQAIPVPEVATAEVFAAPAAPAPIVPLPPVPAAPTAALPMTFTQLMQHITPMLVSGKLNQPILQGVVEKLGLPHLAALGARPDLVETVRAAIDEVCNGTV